MVGLRGRLAALKPTAILFWSRCDATTSFKQLLGRIDSYYRRHHTVCHRLRDQGQPPGLLQEGDLRHVRHIQMRGGRFLLDLRVVVQEEMADTEAKVEVSVATEVQALSEVQRFDEPSPICTTVLISMQVVVEKLTKNVNEDHLREIFGSYGQIRDLDMPLNRQCWFLNNVSISVVTNINSQHESRDGLHLIHV